MKRIFAILMALVMIFCITGCKNKAKTKTNESKPKTTQAAVKKTEEKAKTEKTDASDKEKTEDAEQTDDENQKSDDGEAKQEAKQTSNTGTSGNGSAGNSGGNQSSGSSNNSGNTASTTQKPATTTTTKAPASPERNYGYASQFLSLLNSYRASLGLGTLQQEGWMQEHAMQRATTIIYNFNHTGEPHNLASPTFVNALGETMPLYSNGAECIGGTVPAPPAAMLESFKASGAHNAILTSATGTHVGVGVTNYNGNDYYAVIVYSTNS